MVGRCSCAGTPWVRNLVLYLGSMAASAVGAEALITLHFYERPPYMVARQDYAVGLTATLAGNALGLAGVEQVILSIRSVGGVIAVQAEGFDGKQPARALSISKNKKV